MLNLVICWLNFIATKAWFSGNKWNWKYTCSNYKVLHSSQGTFDHNFSEQLNDATYLRNSAMKQCTERDSFIPVSSWRSSLGNRVITLRNETQCSIAAAFPAPGWGNFSDLLLDSTSPAVPCSACAKAVLWASWPWSAESKVCVIHSCLRLRASGTS